jgi:hypothetical protein
MNDKFTAIIAKTNCFDDPRCSRSPTKGHESESPLLPRELVIAAIQALLLSIAASGISVFSTIASFACERLALPALGPTAERRPM